LGDLFDWKIAEAIDHRAVRWPWLADVNAGAERFARHGGFSAAGRAHDNADLPCFIGARNLDGEPLGHLPAPGEIEHRR
jgi:hypothetical protein